VFDDERECSYCNNSSTVSFSSSTDDRDQLLVIQMREVLVVWDHH